MESGSSPAFPGKDVDDAGMTTLGYYVGQAPVGILSSGELRPISAAHNQEKTATAAWEVAQKCWSNFQEVNLEQNAGRPLMFAASSRNAFLSLREDAAVLITKSS